MSSAARSAPDFELDDTQLALAESLEAFCRDRVDPRADPFESGVWGELAELGVLGLASESGGGLEAAVAFETLGAAWCPGPLVETLLCAQLLGPGSLREDIVGGRRVASIARAGLAAFGLRADTLLALDPAGARPCEVVGELQAIRMHGEPWARGDFLAAPDAESVETGSALALADIAVASYLAGAGLALIQSTADYASRRRQFGRSIGEFQAVAHPLAMSHLRLASARDLSRAAAWAWDRGECGRGRSSAARIAARDASLDAAARGHQVHGAVAYSEESSVPEATRRIRVWARLRPGAESVEEALLDTFAGRKE